MNSAEKVKRVRSHGERFDGGFITTGCCRINYFTALYVSVTGYCAH